MQPAAQISVTRMAVNQASCPGMLQATKSSSLTVRTVLVKRAGQLCDVARGITRPLMPVADRTAVFPTIHSMAHPGIPGMRCMVSARFIWMKVGNMWQPCAVTASNANVERTTSSRQLQSTPSWSQQTDSPRCTWTLGVLHLLLWRARCIC